MRTRRLVVGVLLAIVIVVAAIAAALVLGFLGAPSAGVEDIGDWGTVTDERTEVVTTVWVQNPNPIGVALGESVELTYQLHLNGINLAGGETGALDVHAGNNSVQISTYIQNRDLPRWWVAFVSANETIPVRAEPKARVKGPVSTSADLPTYNTTLLEDSTPVITALSEVAAGTEDEYARTLSASDAQRRLGSSLIEGAPLVDEDVTVGYEVEDAWAEWGEVTEERTVVYFHFLVHNPSERVAVPASPDNLEVDVDMNDVELFSARTNDTTLANPEAFDDRLLLPQQTEEAVYAVEMDNDKIDDWFVSHVERGERTDVRTELRLVFSRGDLTFEIPAENPVAYTCELQTGIFVDGQRTETDCGQVESLSIVEGVDSSADGGGADSEDDSDGSDDSGGGSGDDTADQTPTETEQPTSPVADATATPTSGEAPLEVDFDASGSSDPDGEIRQYAWTFGDGTPPQQGRSVSHTYRTPGEYTATVTVLDDDGNEDTASVTVTVENPIG